MGPCSQGSGSPWEHLKPVRGYNKNFFATQNLAAAVNLQMCANGGIGMDMIECEDAVEAANANGD